MQSGGNGLLDVTDIELPRAFPLHHCIRNKSERSRRRIKTG